MKSNNMYPGIDRRSVRKIVVPTLLLSGKTSSLSHRTIDAELENLLPAKVCRRVVIEDADHGMWFQQPEACRKAVLEFVSRN